MKLREIRIKGFKSIVDQAISLGRLNCFIGANGVGKSNVLEALGVLGAAADGRVDDEHIIRNGVRAGLPRLFKTSFAGHRIPPHISLEATGEPAATFRVALRNPLDRPAPAWSFKTEYLSSGEVPVVSRGVRSAKDNLDETRGLSALKVVELGAEAPASQLVKALQAYAIYTPNTPALRAAVADPQPRRPVDSPAADWPRASRRSRRSSTTSCWTRVLALVDWVLEIGVTDTVGDLLSPSVPRTKHVLKFTDRFMAASRNTLTAADASEGALYVLFAAVLCLSSSSPSVFAIDNLDAALNPRLVTRLVARLAGWLAATDPDRQLLFTAHNPTVLDGLDLDDDEVRLFAVERNSAGHTTVRRITLAPDLARLHAQYPLSRLWAMGHLGAVPSV
jgi:energy-coupling factor transporter ATP-binding protein EcfA2